MRHIDIHFAFIHRFPFKHISPVDDERREECLVALDRSKAIESSVTELFALFVHFPLIEFNFR